jgi:hypothetical protein
VSQKTVAQDKNAEAVLVLPRNYGYGLRSPDDKIWGFWGPDDKTSAVWNASQTLLDRYSYSLDIVYDDKAYTVLNRYQSIFYWNSTII